MERYPAEAPSMFTYLCRIMDMHKRHEGMAWRVYIEIFSRIHALMLSLPSHATNWDLAMDAVHGDTNRSATHRQPSQLFRDYHGQLGSSDNRNNIKLSQLSVLLDTLIIVFQQPKHHFGLHISISIPSSQNAYCPVAALSPLSLYLLVAHPLFVGNFLFFYLDTLVFPLSLY